MNETVSIFNKIKESYPTTTYVNKLPQSVLLTESTPKILLKRITKTKNSTKDISGRFEMIHRVEVIGSNYANVETTAKAITTALESFTDSYVYVCTFDGEFYDTNEEAEVHRLITDYRTFVNL